MVKKFTKHHSTNGLRAKRRDDDHLTQTQRRSRHPAPQGRQIILITMGDLFDQTMLAKPPQHAGDLVTCMAGQQVAQVFVLQAADVELPAHDGREQVEVLPCKQIEAPAAAWSILEGSGDLFQRAQGGRGLLDRRDILQITTVGGYHQLDQCGQAVDGFLQRCQLERLAVVALFHPAVVLEKRHIVGHVLDPQDLAVLVVHLDADALPPATR